MSGDIDLLALPASAMFDTTVLIPALGKKKRASDDAACGPLFEAMIRAKRPVLIAAPSAAELWRREASNTLPRTQYVKIVAFDQLAAEILGRRFPPSVLIEQRDQQNRPLAYIKYDAMIVACAVRHRVAEFVSTDDTQRRLASLAGLVVKAPKDYLAKQLSLRPPSTPSRPPSSAKSPDPKQSKPEQP